MTVASLVTKVIYAGNGVTTSFPISFPYNSAEDITIYYTDPDGVLSVVSSNFEIDEVNDVVNYPVDTMITPIIAGGTKLTIARDTSPTQEVDLTNQGFFNPTVIEQEFDKLTMLIQELTERIGRAIRYNIDESTSETNSEAFILAITAARDAAIANQVATSNNAAAAAVSEAAAALSDAAAAASAAAAAAIIAAGAASYAVSTKTADYTIIAGDKFIRMDATSGNKTVTLPTAIGITGANYFIKKTDSTANTVTIATSLSQTIDGLTTYVIEVQNETVTVISNGATWDLL